MPLFHDIKTVRKHLGYLALTGFFGLTVCNTLVYIAAHSSKALNMALIALCSPVFVAVFARLFLHDTFTLRRIVGLVTATLGAVLLITDGQLSRLMSLTFSEGDVWMLIQAAAFAVYSILVQFKPAELSQTVCLSSMFILGWLFLVPWVAWELIGVKSINFSPTAIGAIIYLGVGPSLLAFFCWNRALIIGPVRAGFVYYCLPLLSGVEALLLLNEPFPLGPCIQWCSDLGWSYCLPRGNENCDVSQFRYQSLSPRLAVRSIADRLDLSFQLRKISYSCGSKTAAEDRTEKK